MFSMKSDLILQKYMQNLPPWWVLLRSCCVSAAHSVNNGAGASPSSLISISPFLFTELQTPHLFLLPTSSSSGHAPPSSSTSYRTAVHIQTAIHQLTTPCLVVYYGNIMGEPIHITWLQIVHERLVL